MALRFRVLVVSCLIAAQFSLALAIVHAATWPSQPASPVGFVDTPAVAIDASGHLHVAYGDLDSAAPGIYYAANATGSWVSQRVTRSEEDYVQWIGVVAGAPMIVYQRPGGTYPTSTYQAVLVQGHWVTSVLFANAAHATFTIDPQGHLHGAFLSTLGLEYATNASGTWSHQVISTSAGAPAIALDPFGGVYVAYQATGGWALAHLADGHWHYQYLPANGGPCWIDPVPSEQIAPALAVDSAGYADVATLSFQSQVADSAGICFMTNRSGSFVPTLIPGLDGGHGVWLGMVLDAANMPHVIVNANGAVDERTWSGSWSVGAVAGLGEEPWGASAASDVLIDSADVIHVVATSALPTITQGAIEHLWRSALAEEPPFNDIVFSPFWADILWLQDSGITSGCSATTYCPTANVTRGQMAAFLDRALDLPATSIDYFTDDEGSQFETDINRLAAAGVTTGCGPTTYCPLDLVTRGQMAAYLDRGLGLPATTSDYFTDDEASSFETDINRVAAARITKGCTPTTYCPSSLVTRGQMAAFLQRALG